MNFIAWRVCGFLLLISLNFLDAEPLSESSLFYRCYSQITRREPDPSSDVYQKVGRGELSAADACMRVLELGNFSANGHLADPTNVEAQSIVKTFHDLHRSWFLVNDFLGVPQFSGDVGYKDGDQDSTEPALFVTRALFTPGIPYSSIVTEPSSVRAVRTTPGSPLDMGRLTGVTLWGAGNATYSFPNGDVLSSVSTTTAVFPFQPKSFGAGILGTQAYIKMNSGFATAFISSDSGNTMHRRMAKNIMSDFLCKTLPALREIDVQEKVIAYNSQGDRSLPFRMNTKCQSCHETMDPLAATYANVYWRRYFGDQTVPIARFHPDPNTQLNNNRIVQAEMITPNSAELKKNGLPIPYHLKTTDNLYYKRPPRSWLQFRTHDGTMISKEISASNGFQAIEALGNEIKDLEEFYICAASRYFEYFTGIQVNLNDEGAPGFRFNTLDRDYKSQVVELGRGLQRDQSLKLLIRQIISSDLYRRGSMR